MRTSFSSNTPTTNRLDWVVSIGCGRWKKAMSNGWVKVWVFHYQHWISTSRQSTSTRRRCSPTLAYPSIHRFVSMSNWFPSPTMINNWLQSACLIATLVDRSWNYRSMISSMFVHRSTRIEQILSDTGRVSKTNRSHRISDSIETQRESGCVCVRWVIAVFFPTHLKWRRIPTDNQIVFSFRTVILFSSTNCPFYHGAIDQHSLNKIDNYWIMSTSATSNIIIRLQNLPNEARAVDIVSEGSRDDDDWVWDLLETILCRFKYSRWGCPCGWVESELGTVQGSVVLSCFVSSRRWERWRVY